MMFEQVGLSELHLSEARTSKDPNHARNVEFLKKFYKCEFKPTELTQYINALRSKFIKAIHSKDSALLDGMKDASLEELHGIIKSNGISYHTSIKSSSIPKDEVKSIQDKYGVSWKDAVSKWKKLRNKYVDALMKVGQEMSDETLRSLKALEQAASKHGINVEKKRDDGKKWDIREKDVQHGVQEFLDSGLIVIDGIPLQPGACKAKAAGGGLQSDINVMNTQNKKQFFIECKLDFASARYFKYGVKIKDGKISYDHSRYIDAAKKNDEDVKKIDELFTNCINIGSFMQDVLKAPEVKKSWEQFGKNIDSMCYWMKNSSVFDGTSDREWREATKHAMMKIDEHDVPADDVPADDASSNARILDGLTFKTGCYPDNFKLIASAFDKYVKYYIDGYNDLIDYMVTNMPDVLMSLYRSPDGSKDDEKFNADDFKIPHAKMSRSGVLSSNELFKYAARMQANADAYSKMADDINASLEDVHDDDGRDMRVEDARDIESIALQMQKVEVKMNALLKHLGKREDDFDALLSLKDDEKLKCLFKMFLSAIGRKRPNDAENRVLDAMSDEQGTMMVCPPTTVENSRLAQMITDFYVKKDHCAYIQIADRLYLFDERHNPLGIERLPVFKEAVTKFIVSLSITDKLDKIKLSIAAIEPDAKAYSETSSLSLVPKHANFICNVLKKPIEVHTAKKARS